jgi:hypothetical protein
MNQTIKRADKQNQAALASAPRASAAARARREFLQTTVFSIRCKVKPRQEFRECWTVELPLWCCFQSKRSLQPAAHSPLLSSTLRVTAATCIVVLDFGIHCATGSSDARFRREVRSISAYRSHSRLRIRLSIL